MAEVTDPAHELTRLLERLSSSTNGRGDNFIAGKLNLDPASLEFYQIIFSIIQRIDSVIVLIHGLPDAEHIRDDMVQHLNAIKSAFEIEKLRSSWSSTGAPFLTASNLLPLKMASPLLRQHVSYPQLSNEERDEVITLVDQLLSWLEEHQLEDNDFIRQAIIEGLQHFRFRLSRLEWLGWNYSVEGLRDVITAYMAMQGGLVDDNSMPITQAALMKINNTMKEVFEKVGIAKDITERADFMLKAYGAVTLAVESGKGISGFLT